MLSDLGFRHLRRGSHLRTRLFAQETRQILPTIPVQRPLLSSLHPYLYDTRDKAAGRHRVYWGAPLLPLPCQLSDQPQGCGHSVESWQPESTALALRLPSIPPGGKGFPEKPTHAPARPMNPSMH